MRRLAVALVLWWSLCGAEAGPYRRAEWRHWIDADHDGQDTRTEVLVDENVGTLLLSKDGRKVLRGVWVCPYSGEVITDPKKLDVDHVVALGEAAASGGQAWSRERKELYANDLSDENHLIAVKASLNRQKGAKDPAAWMPPRKAFGCEYVRIWRDIKRRWRLEIDAAEEAALKDMEAGCEAIRP